MITTRATAASRIGVTCAIGVLLALFHADGVDAAGRCSARIPARQVGAPLRHCVNPVPPPSRRHKDRRPRYSRQLTTVTQLPGWAIPRTGAGRDVTGVIGSVECVDGPPSRRDPGCRPSPGREPSVDLVDALLKPPEASTASLIRSLGLPVIQGVPPIAILGGGEEKSSEKAASGK